METTLFVNLPRGAFGEMRLVKGDAFQRTEETIGREKMEGLAGVVAGDNAGGAPGDLNDVSLAHGSFRGARRRDRSLCGGESFCLKK